MMIAKTTINAMKSLTSLYTSGDTTGSIMSITVTHKAMMMT